MSGSVNKVILIGNLGKDPEIKTFQDGGKIVNLSIATSESWKDRQTGERKEKTQWHNVSIKNEGLCRIAQTYLKKGSKVYLEGQLETRKWQDKQGNDCYSTEVVLNPFRSALTMLSGNAEQSTQRQSQEQIDKDEKAYREAKQGTNSGTYDLNDEIPF